MHFSSNVAKLNKRWQLDLPSGVPIPPTAWGQLCRMRTMPFISLLLLFPHAAQFTPWLSLLSAGQWCLSTEHLLSRYRVVFKMLPLGDEIITAQVSPFSLSVLCLPHLTGESWALGRAGLLGAWAGHAALSQDVELKRGIHRLPLSTRQTIQLDCWPKRAKQRGRI